MLTWFQSLILASIALQTICYQGNGPLCKISKLKGRPGLPVHSTSNKCHEVEKDMKGNDLIDKALKSFLGSSVVFISPSIATAAAEPSAREALQLLSGYQTHTPYWFTWGTLAVMAYILAFEIWKKVLAAW
jgi:hypothetical protein